MEFTNTFENGLHKDSNLILQPKGTYRDMHNGMLVSYDGNHYVVELPKGTRVSFTIPPIYDAVYTVDAALPTPIGFITFLDVLVVFSTNYNTDDTGGSYGEIGIVTFDKDGTGTYLAIYGHESLNFSMFHQIRGFTYEENDKIKRVYWTDDFNEPRVLNVNDPVLDAVASGSLSVGTEYMVTGGAITHNGIIYGPGLTYAATGNTFTAANANFTVTDGSPIVAQYLNYKLLSWSPDRILPNIDFHKPIAGSLYAGSKSYFVRYINKDLGITTSWSYGSFPINVYNIIGSSRTNTQGAGAGGVLVNVNTGVELTISNIDPLYDTMEVAVAEFDQDVNVLRSANIFAAVPITGTSMEVQHTSETSGTELTLNDLTIFPANIFRVKDITTNKNYNVIGNISEREELDFVTTTASVDDLTYKIPTDGNVYTATTGYDKATDAGVPSGSIVPDGKYEVTGTGVVKYGVTDYGQLEVAGPYFTGVGGGVNYTVMSGTPTVRACILIKKYQSQSGVNRWKSILLNDDYFDYRGMAATQYLRQYWSQETYRIGVLFYDLKGNPYYVKWIEDHVTQSYTDKGGPTTYSAGYTSVQINGKVVNNLVIPAADINKISGFSIVRAPRDKQRLAQGLMFPTVRDNANIRPLSLARTTTDANYASYTAFGEPNNWFSPDGLLQFSDFNQVAGNSLEGECFVDPIAPYYIPNGVANEVYSKYYMYAGTRAQDIKIDRYDEVVPNQSIAGYYGGYDYANTFLETTAGGPFGAANATGNSHALVLLQTPPLLVNGEPFVRNTPSATDSYQKMLMNYKVVKNNLYGGQSPQALANTLYISTGHYQPIDATFLSDNYDAGSDSYIVDEIQFFGGDSFLGIFDYCKTMYNDDLGSTYNYFLFFPCESNANAWLRQGRTFVNSGGYNAASGIVYKEAAEQRLEEFGVNSAYATDGSIIAYPALPESIFIDRYPYRVRWAGAKSLGESIDSFRNFSQNDFRDLDGNKGQINNVRSRDGKLFYWQDHGIGYLPILERQVVGGAIGEATQLGVGGVIDRYDEINTYFGNQHTNGLIETEYGFAWFDFRRRAFLAMTVGGGIQEVSFVKGLESFFNDPSLFYASQLTNSGYELQDNDIPLMGRGITGVYDPMYKMTYMTFKWVEGEDEVPTTWKSLTIGYYHPRNIFVGFFDIKGSIYKNHNNWLIGAKNINLASVQASTDYVIGDTVKKDNVEYIAIINFTTHNPVQAYEEPDFAGSLRWAETVSTNEVHLLFNTTAFCKFFGQVYNADIEFVINPKTGKPFTVDNFLHVGNEVNYDVVECNSSDDTATESTNSRFYKYIDRTWQSSVPLGAKGRLVDYYMKAKFTLNNYTTNPTISRNLQKLFEFITSTFREKK